MSKITLLLAAIAAGVLLAAGVVVAQETTSSSAQDTAAPKASSAGPKTSFTMLRSQAAEKNDCLEDAKAKVRIHSVGPNQIMNVSLSGMPKNTEFTVFLLQVPNSPFGLAWYQGDIDTNAHGNGHNSFKGIFSQEVFAIAQPPAVDAAQVHPGVDALQDSTFQPVHTFHLGIWFADPADAEAAGCSNAVTPFDGDHVAGIQALSTRNISTDPAEGPLNIE